MTGGISGISAITGCPATAVERAFRLFGTGLLGLNAGLGTAVLVALLTAVAVRTRTGDGATAVTALWISVVVATITAFPAALLVVRTVPGGRGAGAGWGITSLAAAAVITAVLLRSPTTDRRAGWAALGAALTGWAGVAGALFLGGYTGGGLAWAGVGLGLSVAVAFGCGVYAVAVRIPTRPLLVITGGLLITVTAGILAAGVGTLQQTGWLPGGGAPIFDTTAWSGWWSDPGTLARTVLALTPAPTALQFGAWLSYLVAMPTGIWLTRRHATAAR